MRGRNIAKMDPSYLDAFLQGARFSLFALEGRLRDREDLSRDELIELIDEVHAMYRHAQQGLDQRPRVVRYDRV
ncbi:MAG TPA: hypothetical protein VGB18_03260, partial [Candidatus Thermoplasmatota archaeon]